MIVNYLGKLYTRTNSKLLLFLNRVKTIRIVCPTLGPSLVLSGN